MESINQRVWQSLRSNPAILYGLQKKLINTRALAMNLITLHNLSASLDAVISSIRRFPLEVAQEDEKVLRGIFKDSVVSTTNNMACVTISGLPQEVLERIATLRLPSMRFVSGTEKVKVIVKNGNVEKVKKLFKNVQVAPQLSEISVLVAEEAILTKGVMARIAVELALANINIVELLVCPPQFLIYVGEKDIVRAHERVLSLTE